MKMMIKDKFFFKIQGFRKNKIKINKRCSFPKNFKNNKQHLKIIKLFFIIVVSNY